MCVGVYMCGGMHVWGYTCVGVCMCGGMHVWGYTCVGIYMCGIYMCEGALVISGMHWIVCVCVYGVV